MKLPDIICLTTEKNDRLTDGGAIKVSFAGKYNKTGIEYSIKELWAWNGKAEYKLSRTKV